MVLSPVLKSLIGLALASLFLVWSATRVHVSPSLGPRLQFVGAVCLMIVAGTHVCEALFLLPSMGWGQLHSVGHYLDLSAAVSGITLVSAGYLLSLRRR